jgi:hypothetical protein
MAKCKRQQSYSGMSVIEQDGETSLPTLSGRARDDDDVAVNQIYT